MFDDTTTRRMNLENNGEISSTLIRKSFQFQKICCQTRKYVVFNIIIMIFFYIKCWMKGYTSTLWLLFFSYKKGGNDNLYGSIAIFRARSLRRGLGGDICPSVVTRINKLYSKLCSWILHIAHTYVSYL